MPEDWLKTTEAAEISGYHPNHIRRLIRAGEIVARKWGSALMIDRQSLMDYLQKVRCNLCAVGRMASTDKEKR